MKHPLICLVCCALGFGVARAAEPPRAWVCSPPPPKAACVCGTTCACKPGVCPSGCPLAAPLTPAVQVTAQACQWVPAKYDRFGRVTEWKQVCPLKK